MDSCRRFVVWRVSGMSGAWRDPVWRLGLMANPAGGHVTHPLGKRGGEGIAVLEGPFEYWRWFLITYRQEC